ncbi:surface-adhesin E family protein [Xenophilus sp. Marseille-Q4582]|uniref:surface-adhesin E family protein n=1 Tax=Xenophilus sp. Marseille-Q4582 TaxID=2866600 RepID=UPI001CE3C0A1|nr:surface-adhesin E family protein [Xenophilus sp. Marseille-Q4582]
MKRALLLAGCLIAHSAWAADDWLTLTGDPRQAGLDTVQVNPVALDRSADSRTLHIRVNRARLRNNWDGVPYRSYTAQVRILCEERRGEYLNLRMFVQPLWEGPVQDAHYDEPRPPMRFRDVQPNPTERIIRAACPAS